MKLTNNVEKLVRISLPWYRIAGNLRFIKQKNNTVSDKMRCAWKFTIYRRLLVKKKKKSEQISVQKSDLGKTGRAELGISGQRDLRLPAIWCSFSGFQDAEKSPQHLPIKSWWERKWHNETEVLLFSVKKENLAPQEVTIRLILIWANLSVPGWKSGLVATEGCREGGRFTVLYWVLRRQECWERRTVGTRKETETEEGGRLLRTLAIP